MQNMLFKIGKCGSLESGWSGRWWREADDKRAQFLENKNGEKKTSLDECKKLCNTKSNEMGTYGVCGFKKVFFIC